MRVKPFVRFINYNHIMPTRYNLDVRAAAPPPLRQARVRRSALLLPPPLPPYRARWRCRSWHPLACAAAAPCALTRHTLARPPPPALAPLRAQVSEKLAKLIPDDSLTDAEKAKAVRLEVKKALEERYKALAGVKASDKVATGVTYFFRKLKF